MLYTQIIISQWKYDYKILEYQIPGVLLYSCNIYPNTLEFTDYRFQ